MSMLGLLPRDLQYHLPEAAYLLLLTLLIAYLWYALYRFREKASREWSEGVNEQSLGLLRNRWIFFLCAMALTGVWALAVVAFMQPQGNARYPIPPADANREVPLRRKAHDVIYYLDVSSSMGVKDTRTGATRLAVAQDIADEIASRMDGQSQGLYAFTSQATKIVPPTLDYLFLRLLFRQLRLNEGDVAGTDFKESLKTYQKTFLDPSAPPSLKTLIILSDGGDTTLENETGTERQQRIQEVLDELGDPREAHLRVFTIGIGSEEGKVIPGVEEGGKPVLSRLQSDLLKALASKGRGRYYAASEYSSLDIADDLFARMSRDQLYYRDVNSTGSLDERAKIYDLYFQVPLGAAIILLTFALLVPKRGSMRGLFLVLLFLIPGEGAAVIDPLQRSLEILVEAGHQEEALDLIDKQLAASESFWKRNVLLYNQGTIWLQIQEPKRALASFLEIETQSPVLSARVHWNLALARYQLAMQSLAKLKEPDAAFHDYVAALILLREARYMAQQAQDSHCKIQPAPCKPSPYLHALDQEEENVLVKVALELRQFLMRAAPMIEVLPGLDFSLYDAQFELLFLRDQPMEESLKKRYRNLFAEEQKSWMPLWTAVQFRLPEAYQSLFKQAFAHYRAGVSALTEGDVQDSLTQLQSARAALESLYTTLSEAHPLEGVLEKLLFGYRLALSIYPLQTIEIERLSQEQLQVAKRFPHDRNMQEAQALIQQALQAAKQGDSELPRLYLLAASFQIRSLLHNFKANGPKEDLQLLIEAQEEAEFVNRVIVERQLIKNAALTDLALYLQNLVHDVLKQFWLKVAQEQNEGFKTKCQGQPWETVLPLIERGSRLSKQAGELLQESKIATSTVIAVQEQAQQQYRKALSVWDEAAKQQGCGGGAQAKPEPKAPSQETPSKKEEKGETPQPKEQPGASNLLRLLNELEQDDRQPPEQKVRVPQGVKPW